MQSLAFTLYDMIAYFVPGAIVVWALTGLVGNVELSMEQSAMALPDTALAFAVLAAIYATGHALHAVANLTIDLLPSGGYPPRNYFPDQFEQDFQEPFRSILYNRIVKSFRIQDAQQPGGPTPSTNDRELVNNTVKNAYWACYTTVAQSKSSSLVQVFHSLSGLCRGLCVGCQLIAAIYLVGALLLKDLALLGVVIVALVAGWLFLNRVARFKRYLTKTVYADFMSSGEKSPSEEKLNSLS